MRQRIVPQSGKFRIRSFFAFLPVSTDKEIRHWERVMLLEAKSPVTGNWVPHQFIDDDSNVHYGRCFKSYYAVFNEIDCLSRSVFSAATINDLCNSVYAELEVMPRKYGTTEYGYYSYIEGLVGKTTGVSDKGYEAARADSLDKTKEWLKRMFYSLEKPKTTIEKQIESLSPFEL